MKVVWLHTVAKILLIVLLILYFFAGIGSFYVSGVILWLLCVIFLFVALVISKTVYENAARITTMPKKPDTEAKTEEPVESETMATEPGRDVQCATCGEIYKLDEKFSIPSAPCPACGSIGAVELGSFEETMPPPPPDLEPPPESKPITKVFEGDEEE